MASPEHGGNIYRLLRDNNLTLDTILDFSANINPCGPPAWLRSLVNKELELITHYPDPDSTDLVESISEHHQVKRESVVTANGTTELLHLLPQITARRRAVIPVPSYVDYLAVFKKHDYVIDPLYLTESSGFTLTTDAISDKLRGDEVVIFGNPSNPAGTFLKQELILECARYHDDTLFVIDEAFLDFQSDPRTVGGKLENLITLNSLTKFFAVPGLRLGFGIFPEKYGRRASAIQPQWSVNTLAQKIGAKALSDTTYSSVSRKTCAELNKKMQAELKKIPQLKVFPSTANYILCKLTDGSSCKPIAHKLADSNILIRCCENYEGLDHSFFRVAVKTAEENHILLENLAEILGNNRQSFRKQPKKARSLMFQGTSSNAGKSILTSAFCRIFLQDGLRVAPFKAQNMSLNSYVTKDEMEMGRAQVVQAMAAKLDPDWRMNPILLKPNSDTGSQVIVSGRPVANMNVREYHSYKKTAWESVTKSFDELSAQYECIVLEGAGSPGEINLKKHDIVNMKMAAYAQSPVLLVGDIDRGGVYASFAGIMDVLEEWERKLISGFVVNKFRGDGALLADAHDFIEDHTGKSVLAVVPFVTDLSVPQEDSVSMKDGFYVNSTTAEGQVEICVLDLPHISNFTDIDSLYYEPDVNLKIIRKAEELDSPDALIIPGSKNVGGDLSYLKERGFDHVIRNLADSGCIIVGVCGGYQMLGRKISDPHNIETNSNEIEGIGLIDIETVLSPQKTLQRKEGVHLLSGQRVVGYEIHHGITETEGAPVLSFTDGSTCGSTSRDGSVWGAYLHGIFDEDIFRRWFIDDLRQRKGLLKENRIVAPYNLDESLNELADIVRSCFDMDKIYHIMGM